MKQRPPFPTTSAAAYGSRIGARCARLSGTTKIVLAARFRPRFYKFVVPLSVEGAGNAGCALHPRSRVPRIAHLAHTSIQVSGNTPTSPAQWLYGLLRALPGERACCHRHLRKNLRKLSASIAAPGPHDFAVRSRPGFAKRLRRATAIRLWRAASIASRAQRVVTMAIRPSDGRETALFIILIFRNCKRNYFSCRTDSPNQLEIV